VDVALAGGVFRIPHTNSAAHRPEPRAEPTFTCAGVLVRISRPIRDAVEAVTHTAELPRAMLETCGSAGKNMKEVYLPG